jgi:hypothetical protein
MGTLKILAKFIKKFKQNQIIKKLKFSYFSLRVFELQNTLKRVKVHVPTTTIIYGLLLLALIAIFSFYSFHHNVPLRHCRINYYNEFYYYFLFVFILIFYIFFCLLYFVVVILFALYLQMVTQSILDHVLCNKNHYYEFSIPFSFVDIKKIKNNPHITEHQRRKVG